MGSVDAELLSSVLLLPADMVIEAVYSTTTHLTVQVACTLQSGLPEFKKMAKGIRQDYTAVKAAFSSMWSNGQVEAQVNCLKLQKRIVFGRANFDLLRLRVLCRA